MIEKHKYLILNFIVFISGAVLMVLELTGSRILAPHVGNSLFVWTGLIGIILGSLSVGYMLGGKLADKNPELKLLSDILLLSALTIAIIPLEGKLLSPLITSIFNTRISSLLLILILFALPSILLGIVSPYAIRLKLQNVNTSGATAGRLYAISTLGSILGTFVAGFFLIEFLGSTTILYVLAFIMIFLALITDRNYLLKKLLFISAILLIIIFITLQLDKVLYKNIIVDKETKYNRVIIYDIYNKNTKLTTREMLIGNEHSSAMFLENNQLVYDYTKYFRLIDQFVPNLKNALVIGGAGYSYPKDFLLTHSKSKLDVVEIDSALTQFAEKYFKFIPNQNTQIFHEDARTFLNKESKTYDAIINDAFSSYYSHPLQLATKEAITHMYNMLSPNGVIISNTISSIDGDNGKFLRAEYFTYKSVFNYVEIFPVFNAKDGLSVQNVILIASKNKLNLTPINSEFKKYISTNWKSPIEKNVPIFTDDYAPVEQYAKNLID